MHRILSSTSVCRSALFFVLSALLFTSTVGGSALGSCSEALESESKTVEPSPKVSEIEEILASIQTYIDWLHSETSQRFLQTLTNQVNLHLKIHEQGQKVLPGKKEAEQQEEFQSWIISALDQNHIEISEEALTLLMASTHAFPRPRVVSEVPQVGSERLRKAVKALSGSEKKAIGYAIRATPKVRRALEALGYRQNVRVNINFAGVLRDFAVRVVPVLTQLPITLAVAQQRVDWHSSQRVGKKFAELAARSTIAILGLEFTPEVSVGEMQRIFLSEAVGVDRYWKKVLRGVRSEESRLALVRWTESAEPMQGAYQPNFAFKPLSRKERLHRYAEEQMRLVQEDDVDSDASEQEDPSDSETDIALDPEEELPESVVSGSKELPLESGWDEEDLDDLLQRRLAHPNEARRFVKWLKQQGNQAPAIVTALFRLDDEPNMRALIEEKVVSKIRIRPDLYELRPLGGKTWTRLFFGVSKTHGWILCGWRVLDDHGNHLSAAAVEAYRKWHRSDRT